MSFTNEMLVRQRGLFRLFDEVPSDLLARCINTAHERVLESTTGLDESDPPMAVVEAETDLTMAEVLRTLAVSRELDQPLFRTPDLSFEDSRQVRRLLELAGMEEWRAWSRLRPYLKHKEPGPLDLQRPTTST